MGRRSSKKKSEADGALNTRTGGQVPQQGLSFNLNAVNPSAAMPMHQAPLFLGGHTQQEFDPPLPHPTAPGQGGFSPQFAMQQQPMMQQGVTGFGSPGFHAAQPISLDMKLMPTMPQPFIDFDSQTAHPANVYPLNQSFANVQIPPIGEPMGATLPTDMFAPYLAQPYFPGQAPQSPARGSGRQRHSRGLLRRPIPEDWKYQATLNAQYGPASPQFGHHHPEGSLFPQGPSSPQGRDRRTVMNQGSGRGRPSPLRNIQASTPGHHQLPPPVANFQPERSNYVHAWAPTSLHAPPAPNVGTLSHLPPARPDSSNTNHSNSSSNTFNDYACEPCRYIYDMLFPGRANGLRKHILHFIAAAERDPNGPSADERWRLMKMWHHGLYDMTVAGVLVAVVNGMASEETEKRFEEVLRELKDESEKGEEVETQDTEWEG